MRRHYDILVVDDDLDVLTVTNLALKNMRYGSLPVRIHSATSAETARGLLAGKSFLPRMALAIVDVVMESDTAGLDLCEYIRDRQNNNITQLIVRTGQAARFPESEVVERYDISGFVAKSDATDQRLVSTVKTSIRQYDWACTAALFYQMYNSLILGFRSPSELCDTIDGFIRKAFFDDESIRESYDPHLAISLGDLRVVTGAFADSLELDTLADNLAAAAEKVLNVQGDSYREAPNRHGSLDVSLTLGRSNDKVPDVRVVARVQSPPPSYAIQMWIKLLYALRRLVMVSSLVEDLLLDSKLQRVWPADSGEA